MKLRPLFHITLLIIAMQATSAFKFRCYWFCTDQTAIQADYTENRDDCRKYAELRIQTDTSNPDALNQRARKAKLISLFSACMADKGWTVPDGKGGQQASAPVPVPTPGAAAGMAPASAIPTTAGAPAAAVASTTIVANPAIITAEEAETITAQRREKTYLARQSECAFARHGAAYSSVSATRAKACDIECAQRLKQAPKATRPAACPADPNEIPGPK